MPASLPSLDVPRNIARMDWGDLAPMVQDRLTASFGEYVSEEPASAGRSLSFASKMRFRDQSTGAERQVFVKAVPSSHEGQFRLCEGEIAIQGMLGRRGASIPETFSTWTMTPAFGETWRVMAYEVIANSHSPGNPWTEREFRQIGDAILEMVPHLTAPELVPRIKPLVASAWSWSDLRGWQLVPRQLDPYVDALDDLHNHLAAAVDGDHVVHADMAESNVLLAGERTFLIDWNPKLSQPWTMWVDLASGGPCARHRRQPRLRRAPAHQTHPAGTHHGGDRR